MKNYKSNWCLIHNCFRIKDNPLFSLASASTSTIVPVIILSLEKIKSKHGKTVNELLFEEQVLPSFLKACGRNHIQPLIFETVDDFLKDYNSDAPFHTYAPLSSEPEYVSLLKKLDTVRTTILPDCNYITNFFSVLPASKTPYKVYSQFFKTASNSLNIRPLQKSDFKSYSENKDITKVSAIQWENKILSQFELTEEKAQEDLNIYVSSKLEHYDTVRDIPHAYGTSLMSTYLHFGILSPHQIYHACINKDKSYKSSQYVKELYWRDFCSYVLFHYPYTYNKPLNKKFNSFLWQNETKKINAWKKGKTGFPIIDAGMRELWETGLMHNRVRMLTASFLIKDLLTDWKIGEEWFRYTLADADLASNIFNWQWSSGGGADASPFFRIFNPITQGEKFDKNAKYITNFVPELKNIDPKIIHNISEHKNIEYVQPIVDHSVQREKALENFKKI